MNADQDSGPTSVPGDEDVVKSPRSNESMPGVYKVPHRFDLATMFVVTFAFATLLGVLRACDVPTIVQISLMGLLSAVGVVQMMVPLRYVRVAAVICGWVVYMTTVIVSQMAQQLPMSSQEIQGLLCGMLVVGSLMGYVAGVVDAGVFLVADYVRKGAIRALGRDR